MAKKREFEKGQKVWPLSKIVGYKTMPAEASIVYKKALEQGQDFLYVIDYNKKGLVMCAIKFAFGQAYDCFHENDLV